MCWNWSLARVEGILMTGLSSNSLPIVWIPRPTGNSHHRNGTRPVFLTLRCHSASDGTSPRYSPTLGLPGRSSGRTTTSASVSRSLLMSCFGLWRLLLMRVLLIEFRQLDPHNSWTILGRHPSAMAEEGGLRRGACRGMRRDDAMKMQLNLQIYHATDPLDETLRLVLLLPDADDLIQWGARRD
ncbi:MAG: hypothetical protein KatS3mg111_2256 [Pirellulaceae bacterium]|nr:MAG: hypothetical protein KatS3mg111_2256 [Pirellulaceae bacterium]